MQNDVARSAERAAVRTLQIGSATYHPRADSFPLHIRTCQVFKLAQPTTS